jgi:hypothetical protein
MYVCCMYVCYMYVRLFMIISHVKIIAFQLSLFCKNYRFSKTALYIINRKIYGCLEIPDLFLVLNIRFISRVEHKLEINLQLRPATYYKISNAKFANFVWICITSGKMHHITSGKMHHKCTKINVAIPKA